MPQVLTIILFSLALVFLLDENQVDAECHVSGDKLDSNWLACLVAENNIKDGQCPYNFQKITTTSCQRGWGQSRSPPYKNLVCCVLKPTVDLKILKSACVAGTNSQ